MFGELSRCFKGLGLGCGKNASKVDGCTQHEPTHVDTARVGYGVVSNSREQACLKFKGSFKAEDAQLCLEWN